MKKVLLSSIVCATMMFAANNEYKYEVTPIIGASIAEHNTDLEDHFSNAGLTIGINTLGDSFIDQVEIGFLQTIEDVDYKKVTNRDTGILRVFTNVVKNYEINSDVSLYTLAGLGYEFFDDEYAGNEDSIFANYGAGVKYNITDGLDFKFDLRHLIETDHGDNTLLATMGLAYSFIKVNKPVPVPIKIVEKKPMKIVPKDTDEDGVIDEKDKCPDTMKGAQVDDLGCITLVDLKINFDVDSSVIKDTYDSKIIEFAKVLKKYNKLKATIEAHTDSTASNEYNQKLSERRAASAVEALKAQNIDPSRLTAIGYGETRPIATNKTVEGRAENRRVTAVITK